MTRAVRRGTRAVADPFDVVTGPKTELRGPRSEQSGWMDEAACKDSGLEFVIDERRPSGDPIGSRSLKLLLAVCEECPVKRECLEYAFEQPSSIEFGVYGGTAAFQRRTAQHLPNRIELLLEDA